MCGQHRWSDAPHIFGITLKELRMRRTFEVEPKLLMKRKLVVACLRISVQVRIVLQRMKLFHYSTELLPRTLAPR